MPGPPSIFDVARPLAALPPSDYIQPNFGHALRIWWAFWWRTTLVAVVLTLVANIGLRRMYENFWASGHLIGPILKYDAYFFTYAIAFFVMAYMLRKNFRNFRIGLLSSRGGERAQQLPPTLSRTARVWWIYCWRTLVYRLIVGFAASFPLGWLVGFLLAVVPAPAFAAFLSTIVYTAIDGAAGMFVIYSNILDEDIGDFRVALLPRTGAADLVAAPASLAGGRG